MNEKHPNRKKDKHNPYTLMIVEGRYYLSFKDGRGIMQNIEIDKVLYDLFNRFELEDMQKILSQSVKTLRLYIRTQNCVPMQVSRMTNCVYIVAPTHCECIAKLTYCDDKRK